MNGTGDERRGARGEGKHSIYLDNNATTPLDPRVLEDMTKVWRDCGANPASQHAAGRRARRLVEEAREGILELLGAQTSGMGADELIFTSGGTEANIAILTDLRDPAGELYGLAISAIEHPSTTGTVRILNDYGTFTWSIPVLPSGVIDLEAADGLLDLEPHRPYLLSVMLANNETGIVQPVAELCRRAARKRTIVHTDAVQAVGKMPVNFRELGVSAMTVAPHKFHGPLGIGGLVVRKEVLIERGLGGPSQGLRGGTQSPALAVGFHRALQYAIEEGLSRYERMRDLRDRFERLIKEQLPTTVVIGEDILRIPQTSCLSFPPLDRQYLLLALDQVGVACSTGSACASGSSEPSPTLVAMNLCGAVLGGALRFSLGAFTTAAEVTESTERIINTVKRLQPQRK